MALDSSTKQRVSASPRFATAKFRPVMVPATLVARPELHRRLSAGASSLLTTVVASAGAGKSVLLSSWVSERPAETSSWLSCDGADTDPRRFWAGFIEAGRAVSPQFGSEADELLAANRGVSADITASLANDAAALPQGSVIVVDDFQYAAAAVSGEMTDLVERWPAASVQLVLAARSDPPLRLHRLRMSGDLCELRDRDLCFSVDECRSLLANFGVEMTQAELARLQENSEGWAAAVQMAALALRDADSPAQLAHALDLRTHAIPDYFVAEVLDRQPSEHAQFMLDTSILCELSAEACAAVTGRQDAAAMLRTLDTAGLFLVALDEERTSFRYHRLVQQVLRAEQRTRDPSREHDLLIRAAEWLVSRGEARNAARLFVAAGEVDRALALLQAEVMADFLREPSLSPPLDPTTIDVSIFADASERAVPLATDLLVAGDVSHGADYLDMIDRAAPHVDPDSCLAAQIAGTRALQYLLTGHADEAVPEALASRDIWQRQDSADKWIVATTAVLLRAYAYLGDYEAVEREASRAAATPEIAQPVILAAARSAQAIARLEFGLIGGAEEAAVAADEVATRLGLGQHYFAADYLRTLAGLALERRDFDEAEQLNGRALAISARRRPSAEYLALLDRAAIREGQGQVHEALAIVENARHVLADWNGVLLNRADELEALLRLSLGDLDRAVDLASALPSESRLLTLARIALAAGDWSHAEEHLASMPGQVSVRQAMVKQILLAASAIERNDPMVATSVADLVDAARRRGFCHAVVTTAPQVTGYLIEHFTRVRPDPFLERLIAAALEARNSEPDRPATCRGLAEPLTDAECRVLKLLPTSTYLQMAESLYISRNTVKTHLRSIYHKLVVTSRAEAIQRAVDLRLL